MLERRGGRGAERSGGGLVGRRGGIALALGCLLGLLAEPAGATSIGGGLPAPAASIPALLRDFLESHPGLARRDPFRPLDFPLGEEVLRITRVPLPGDDSPLLDSRRFRDHFHRRAHGASGFVPGGGAGSPGTTAIPEPTTLALLGAGLAAASLACRRPRRR